MGVQAVAPHSMTAATHSADASAAPLWFLVIDTDPVHRMVIGKVGEKAGYKVTTASSVQEAAEKMAQRAFDCISLDLTLGAPEILSRIARSTGDILLMLVNSAAAAVREEAVDSARDFRLTVVELPKPVDLATLRTRLTGHAAIARS